MEQAKNPRDTAHKRVEKTGRKIFTIDAHIYNQQLKY